MLASMGIHWIATLCSLCVLLTCSGHISCPGEQTECKDGETCCEDATGQFGCCGARNAVCCDDHVHCCPEGYYCDMTAQECRRGSSGQLQLPFMNLKPRTLSGQGQLANKLIHTIDEGTDGDYNGDDDGVRLKSELTMCPDGHMCPGNETCCLQKTGLYGCCSLVRAVCCADGIQCCPEGYRCVKAQNSSHVSCEARPSSNSHRFSPRLQYKGDPATKGLLQAPVLLRMPLTPGYIQDSDLSATGIHARDLDGERNGNHIGKVGRL